MLIHVIQSEALSFFLQQWFCGLLPSCKIGNCPEEHFIMKPQFLNEVLLLKKELHKLLQHQSRSWPILCRLVKTRCQQAPSVVRTVFVQSEDANGYKYTKLHLRITYSLGSMMPELWL